MKHRSLTRTGPLLSVIGFGGWGIGGLTGGLTSYGATDDATSRRALDCALDLGITFFDTANVYGDGHSEALIGAAIAGRRDSVVISTKAGLTRFGEAPDFSRRGIERSLDDSLARLRTDHVDILFLHDPDVAALPVLDDAVDTLRALRRLGKTRHIGLSLRNPTDGIAAIGRYGIDALQVNLNMMDVRAVTCGLLDRAAATGTGIVARTPLCFGFLTGAIDRDTAFPPGDHRNGWPREQLHAWIDGAEALFAAVPPPAGQSRTQLALRFCLSFPAVTSVIPGIATPREAEINAAAGELGGLAPAEVEAILALNARMPFFRRRPARPNAA